MIINEDFKFRDDIKEDTAPIELLTGNFKNVIFRFTNIAIQEEQDGSAVLNFGFDIKDPGKFSEATLYSDENFAKHLGLILNKLILEAVEMVDGQTGNDNTESIVEE